MELVCDVMRCDECSTCSEELEVYVWQFVRRVYSTLSKESEMKEMIRYVTASPCPRCGKPCDKTGVSISVGDPYRRSRRLVQERKGI